MSLSWRDRFVGVLSPQRVLLVRRPRGRRTGYEVTSEAPTAGPTPRAALDALATLLARPDCGAGDLTLVVSNHFVSYLLLPWRGELGSPRELASFAAICFDETYGADAGGRVIVTSRERAGGARIAAALEASFLTGLSAAAAPSRLRLRSVQPYLCAVFNDVRRGLPDRDFLLVVAEPARSCVLVASGGHWRSLRTVSGPARALEIAELVEREAQLAGLDDGAMPPVFVHVPGQAALQLRSCHGVQPTCLTLPRARDVAAGDDAALAMAMAVA